MLKSSQTACHSHKTNALPELTIVYINILTFMETGAVGEPT
jgi:hypothetical protein